MYKAFVYIYRLLWRFFNSYKYKALGKRSIIYQPLKINGHKNISIGENVTIQYKTWLAAVPLTGNPEPVLIIGDGTAIGHFNHIFATSRIEIGQKVLTADRVYISDNLHGFEDVSQPIMNQAIKQIGEVIIGDNTWLGENVCVIGAKIGKNCVIGANSVVTKDIPSYCVVVGTPAKIIKRYNFDTLAWEKTNPDGSFLNKL